MQGFAHGCEFQTKSVSMNETVGVKVSPTVTCHVGVDVPEVDRTPRTVRTMQAVT